MLRYTLYILGILLTTVVQSQSFKFRHFGETDGMGSRYVNTLNQDPMGRLLIGTGEGLYRYDGFRFSSFTRKDSLADNLIESSCNLSDGSILFGHSNGSLTRYFNGRLEPIRLESYFRSRITSIVQDNKGFVWVASQNNGIIRFDRQWNPTHFTDGLEEYNLYSLESSNDVLWIGTDMGLLSATTSANGEMNVEEIDEIPPTNVTHLFREKSGSLLVSTEDEGAFRIASRSGQRTVVPITYLGETLEQYHIKHLRSDETGAIWLSTNQDGLISLYGGREANYERLTRYAEQGVSKNQSTRISFSDRENNLWIGTIGSGLIRLEDNYFSMYGADQLADPAIHAVFFSGKSGFAGGFGGLIELNEEGVPSSVIHDHREGLPGSRITAIHRDQDGVLWIGTSEHGLWKKESSASRFVAVYLSEDLLNQKINAIISHKDMIYVGTDFGAYALRQNQVVSHMTIENGLSGNVIRCFFLDSRERIWVGTTTSEFNFIEHGGIKRFPSLISNSSFPVRCFAEDLSGTIWAGTEGLGIMRVTSDEYAGFSKAAGLYSDFCYSLTCDKNNRLWVGQRGALSIVDLNDGRISIKSPGKTGDVHFHENAVTSTDNGEVLFGTNFGLLRYDPSLDRLNSIPPIVSLDRIIISDQDFPANQAIRLKAGDYKLEIFYSGISLVNAETVNYQFMLEGYDDKWSALTTDRRTVYNHLPPGNYVFKVKAYNEDGFAGEEVSTMPIYIARPFWQQWWFILLGLLLGFTIVRIIIIRRERFLKQNQEYLKRELAARTQEVVNQKELLEVKNKDITDSILYAKNIQTAVLPPDSMLTSCFNDSFVYYQPRDIVSGDFYWIGETENKVLVACADCTGHGVPGAFMSLIGSMLMKEVALDDRVTSPDEFLMRLHERLIQIFMQPGRTDSLSDGMDVSLIEFDRHSGMVRIASANRPVFLMHNGEFIELKGDRNAIGGSDSTQSTGFILHEFTLKPGDVLYQFSDGITDQFGGEKGKKLKRNGLRQLIESNSHLPMTEQKIRIRDYFNNWRGQLSQVDDVLLIGIRF